MIGKIARMVSETSLTESSIPPICANKAFEISNKIAVEYNGFFISKRVFKLFDFAIGKILYIVIQNTVYQYFVNKINFKTICFFLMRIGIKSYENLEICC